MRNACGESLSGAENETKKERERENAERGSEKKAGIVGSFLIRLPSREGDRSGESSFSYENTFLQLTRPEKQRSGHTGAGGIDWLCLSGTGLDYVVRASPENRQIQQMGAAFWHVSLAGRQQGRPVAQERMQLPESQRGLGYDLHCAAVNLHIKLAGRPVRWVKSSGRWDKESLSPLAVRLVRLVAACGRLPKA